MTCKHFANDGYYVKFNTLKPDVDTGLCYRAAAVVAKMMAETIKW